MQLTIALAQCGYPADGDVPAQVDAWCAKAAACKAGLLVFPEDLMSPKSLSADELRARAEPLDGCFVRSVSASAARHGIWVALTFYELDPAGGRPFNTAALVDASGNVVATYRKTHLYDAYDVRESERTGRGDALMVPVETPFGRIGLAICYDLRFPEVTRTAALEGCELMLFPSAWHDGPEKAAHWETLLRARAIENEIFVVGTCRAGERYVGRSLVADPLGRVLACAKGKEEELVVYSIDTKVAEEARNNMPLLDHRRPELYDALR